MAVKALASDIQSPEIHERRETANVIRTPGRAGKAAHILDVSILAEPCRSCVTRNNCKAARLLGMASDRNAASDLHTRALLQGEHLHFHGENQKYVYFIKAGSAKTYLLSTAGDEQILDFHFHGDLPGIEALLQNGVYNSSTITLERTEVCAIPAVRLERLVRHARGGQQWLLGLASDEVVHYHRSLVALNKMTAERRLGCFLLDLSRRLRRQGSPTGEFFLSMSRQDIANHLGLALETVSRLMTRFQQDGLIEISRRRWITIRNSTSLAGR